MRFVCRHHSVKHDLLCPMHLKLILQLLVLLNSFRHIASQHGVTTSGNFRNSIVLLRFCYPVLISFNKPLILANKGNISEKLSPLPKMFPNVFCIVRASLSKSLLHLVCLSLPPHAPETYNI